LRRMLLWLAQALISVPSTLKCSPDSSPRCSAMFTVALKSSVTASCSMSRSRFLLNTEWVHTASSMDRPTNQRKSRLYLVCSTNCHSLRMLNSTCSSIASISFSGAMLGRPPRMSASYMAENFSSILASVSFIQMRIGRSGWLAGTNSSSPIVLN